MTHPAARDGRLGGYVFSSHPPTCAAELVQRIALVESDLADQLRLRDLILARQRQRSGRTLEDVEEQWIARSECERLARKAAVMRGVLASLRHKHPDVANVAGVAEAIAGRAAVN